jgi:hypothetical protein
MVIGGYSINDYKWLLMDIVATLLWPSVGVKPNTWKKVRIWSPPGLPNV